jgi:dynein heavy chain
VKSSKKLVDEWNSLKKLAKETKKEITPLVEKESKNVGNAINKLDDELAAFNKSMRKRDFYLYDKGVKGAKEGLAKVSAEIENHKATIFEYKNNATKFGNPELIETSEKAIEVATNEVAVMSQLWQHIEKCLQIFDGYMAQKWIDTNADQMEEDVKKLQATLKSYTKVDKRCSAYIGLLDECKKWLVFLPMVTSLRSPNMRDRHWASIKELVKSDFKIDDSLVLKAIYDLNLGKFSDDVEEITDQAGQEARMEKTLKEFEEFWVSVDYDFDKHKGSEVMMLRLNEENFEKLEEHQTLCQAMFSSRYLATFEEKVILWQKQLAAISEITQLCQEIQRTWSFLENLFIHSEEVKRELPQESEKFVEIDNNVKKILNDAHTKKKALDFCVQDYVLPALEQAEKELKVCEKALYEFMEGKRRAFPRFYFCSTTQLLDILSNGSSPSKVMEHMPAIFLNIATLELKDDGDRPKAVKIISGNGPGEVDFYEPLKLVNKVENYL